MYKNMDISVLRSDPTKSETDHLAYGEDEDTIKIYKAKTVQERMDIRFDGGKDRVAIVAKENLLPLPFKGVPHPDYPSPWLTVSYEEYGRLVRATAYVLKKRFDFPPHTRVGIVGNALPHYQLLVFALWYNRCIPVGIPPKLGNDVKQFWARMLDIKMFFYDKNLVIYDAEKQKPLDEGGEWIWPWEYPLKEDEYNLSAGFKGITMFSMYQKDFCEEIYQCKLEGKSFKREGHEKDIVVIVGTSSSSQAIIKNGQCSKMKFVGFDCHNECTPYQNYMTHYKGQYISTFVNVPFYHGMGNSWVLSYSITYGGPTIYHTQQLVDIGFIPENVLDDVMETNADRILLFPFHYAEFKKLFDNNHPRCPLWKKFFKSRHGFCFRTGGAPLNPEIAEWFEKEFDHKIVLEYGSSESNMMMYADVTSEILPGEDGFYTRAPWCDFYLKPLDEKDPTIGELYVYSTFLSPGYVRRAEKGEFYESPIPGLRINVEAENLFTEINGLNFYKTNDIWYRSPKSGKYQYISRVDDVLTFGTGLKMNPLPFESTIKNDCDDVAHCCLLLDDTQYEVVCFIEPVWSQILMEDGKPFDNTTNPETLSKSEIVKLRKTAQKQVWNSIYNVLMDSSKSLSNWAKQLTINNIVIVDYGKKFPVTAKGSLARRVARLEYSHVLKKIAKLISGEIAEIEDEEKEKEEKEVETSASQETKETSLTEPKKEISDDTPTTPKTQEEIDEEIQKAIVMVYESIKEIVPSTPAFEDFNIQGPFTMYSIDSLATRKLTNVLARKTKKDISASVLFNYGTPLDLAKYITGHIDQSKKETIPISLKDHTTTNSKIAIIGMGLRLPGAINNAKSFWMALAKGRDCVMAPVKDRDLHTGYVDKPANLLGEHEHNIPRCGCYDNRGNVAKPSEFDAEFFNCLPEEANAMDPRHRWVLETSWEALENAGIAPNTLENTLTGVFVGINDDHDYADVMKQNGIIPPIASHATSPSGIVGRLSYFYKLFGPSFTIDTACSTGVSALHTACRSLQFGDCDLSVVSGVKYMYSSSEFHRTSVARMTSPNGRCATFDKDADGFAPGEGCVTFILKRYDDAVRDHDNILSVILGTSSGQSGSRQSISAPSSDGQVLNLKRALQFAGVTPDQVSYVEAHGTGTPLGDAIEVDALNQVYSGTHSPEHPLVIGSVKTNIGHTCEAAGLAGMAKVIVAMQHKYIPKHLHFNQLNPEIDIEAIPLQIATKTMPWEVKNHEARIAQVSSFGLQGSIVHVILQEYLPETDDESGQNDNKSQESEEDHILTISAKSHAALLELCNNYLSILEGMEDNEENIEDLCYTSNVGRQHFEYRISASGKNASELYDDLEQQLDELESRDNDATATIPSTTGRGISQQLEIYSDIIKDETIIPEKVYETISKLLSGENAFKEAFMECDSEIQSLFEGVSLIQMIQEKPKDRKMKQVLLLSFYYSLQKLLEKVMVRDNSQRMIYGGFGFGELISIILCGGLTIHQGLSLVSMNTELDASKMAEWYNQQQQSSSLPKFQKNVYLGSLDKEIKNGEILSLDDLQTILNGMDNATITPSFMERYVPKSKSINVYSMMKDSSNDLSSSKAHLIKFIDEDAKTDLYTQYILRQYHCGQTINWVEYNHMAQPSQRHYKVELPTYPFQRSTYWPVPLH